VPWTLLRELMGFRRVSATVTSLLGRRGRRCVPYTARIAKRLRSNRCVKQEDGPSSQSFAPDPEAGRGGGAIGQRWDFPDLSARRSLCLESATAALQKRRVRWSESNQDRVHTGGCRTRNIRPRPKQVAAPHQPQRHEHCQATLRTGTQVLSLHKRNGATRGARRCRAVAA